MLRNCFCPGLRRGKAGHKQNELIQAKKDAYPSPSYYSCELRLDSWQLQPCATPTAQEPAVFLPSPSWPSPSSLSPDLSSVLFSSQFPMGAIVEYLGPIFHPSCPSFCDAIILVCATSTPVPGWWNCPSSYVGQTLPKKSSAKTGAEKGSSNACVLRNMGDVGHGTICLLCPQWQGPRLTQHHYFLIVVIFIILWSVAHNPLTSAGFYSHTIHTC